MISRPMQRHNLRDMRQEEVVAFCQRLGHPAYRGRQLFAWLYRPGVRSFAQMTDLPKEFRAQLAATASLDLPEVAEVQRSEDGTRKLLFRLADGVRIESVLIPEEERQTLCVSTQAGCAMGCVFCMTGRLGFRRNLRPAEIVGQVIAARNLLAAETAPPLTNLVFMGMGEPLANLANCLAAIDILTDQRGLDFSPRRLTVSTSGLAPKIHELGRRCQGKINLAISLHAPNDAIRDQLMPVNHTYPIAALLAACRAYPLPRRKRIMIEYILIKGINDADTHAQALGRLLRGLRVKINLLPYNPVEGVAFHPPSAERVARFQEILWQQGYTVLLRQSRGQDIDAACGQLAGRASA